MDMYPIPIQYFKDVHRPDFWAHARTFGGEASFMGPKTEGVRRYLDENALDSSFNQTPGRSTGCADSTAHFLHTLDIPMTQDQIGALGIENRRRHRALRIHSNFRAAQR